MYPAKFYGAESQVARQRDRVQPELGRLVVAIDLHVRQFVGFVTVEVDAIRTRSQSRRYGSSISRRSSIGDRLARPLMRSSMIYDEGLPYNIID